jgi:L-alanine-DL-glutamate epimerase-like enolase superfamily enzyme
LKTSNTLEQVRRESAVKSYKSVVKSEIPLPPPPVLPVKGRTIKHTRVPQVEVASNSGNVGVGLVPPNTYSSNY